MSRSPRPVQGRPSVILFDFGGTLADIYPSHEWLFIRPCRELGVEVDAARVRAGQDMGWDPYLTPEGPAHPEMSLSQAIFRRFKTGQLVTRLQAMGVTGPVEAIAKKVLDLDTRPEMYRVFDDVLPTLQVLAERGYRMAIISNHEWELPDLVAGLGLADYFPVVITSARVGYRKPHPRIYQYALERLGATAEETLVVGDSLSSDVAGALRLGMTAVLLDRHGADNDPPGVPVIRRLTSLLELL